MKEKDIKEEKYRSIPEGLKTEIQAHKEWLELSKKQQEDQVCLKLDVRNKNLSNLDLNYPLDHARLDGCCFDGSLMGSLDGACLAGCSLNNTCFNQSLENANLEAVNGEEACFAGTKCTGANFNRATLCKANFTCTKLSGAKFQEADLRDADLRGADLSGAAFYLADISGAKLCLNDITMEQLGQCLFTPELKQMIQAKYQLMTCKSN